MTVSPLVDPLSLVAEVVTSVWTPPPSPDYNAWAEAPEGIVFGSESPKPGPYRRDTLMPSERILEVLSPEHPARVVTLMGSAQIIKTTIGQIFTGATLDLNPCAFLYVHPTHDNAMRWARGKWRTMRNQSKALRKIFGSEESERKRKRGAATDTLLYQERLDGRGSIQISGANSAASLSMISVPCQVQDDLSKWEPNEGGDPERQADSRSAAFDWAKILKLGTPLFAKTCRITKRYREGTQERWHVPCPHCDHKQPLEWENFQGNIDPERPASAHFTCVACGCEIEHKHKEAIVLAGEWVADNPTARDPSFHIWRAYSPTRDWASIAHEWLSAEGDPYAEQTFYNDVLGLPYERASEAPPWEALRDRADDGPHVYEQRKIPPGGLLLCAGVDCQGDRIEVHVKAFGWGLRRWTVDYRIIPGHISEDIVRHQLNELLDTAWPDTFGNQRKLDMLAIDGNAYTNDVFDWAKHWSWNRVIVVRGAKSDQAPPLALAKTERRPDGKVRKTQKRFYNVGVAQMKMTFYECLKKIDPVAKGYCGYPRGMGDEFFRQMTAERREIKVDKYGFAQAFWVNDYGRNEVLDTEMYAEAAAIRCGWHYRTDDEWMRLAGQLEREPERGTPDLFDPARTAGAQSPGEKVVAEEPNESDSATSADSSEDFLGDRGNDFWRGRD